MKKVAIIGSGSWGTALAVLLHNNGHNVSIWSFKKEEADSIRQNLENKEYLPGISLSEEINITHIEQQAVENADIVVLSTPSKFVRAITNRFKPYLNENQIIVNVAKGLEEDTLYTLSEVIESELPKNPVCVLSGPSHAEEVGRGIPTTCVVACEDIKTAEYVQNIFMNPVFRVYTNTDIMGVEIGGALKNVIALAAGTSDGLGFGDNTKAALMTRGIAEISRLGVAMGAKRETFSGLTGIGDLIVTCTSMHSRNRRAGMLLGQGKSLSETLEEVHQVVEGVNTAKAAFDLAKKYNVVMPITEEINKVLFENKEAKQAVVDLMTRDKTVEHEKEDTTI
jgi:glycerol-3-phosphate dehydrogenase (NAD(P)+)